MINAELIKIILIFPFFIFFYLISSYKKYIYTDYSLYFLCIFIVFYTILEFILIGNHNIYEWLTVIELPIIENVINNKILFNDFYTISSVNSPKIYFAKFISLITLGFFEHEIILYFLKLTIIFFQPLLIFLILNNFTEKNKYYLFNSSPYTKSISALFAIGYLNFINPSISIGWDSFVNWKFINTLNFSIFLGLIAIYLFQKYTLKNFIGMMILFLATFIHPVVGLVNFILILLLFNNFKKFKDLLKLFTLNKLLILLIVIIIPYIYLVLNFSNSENISEDILKDVAVKYRHSHHYVISSFFDLKTLVWLSIPLFTYLYSIYTKNIKGQIYSILFFLIISGSFLIQYFFTEIYFFSTISIKLQPIRIMTHSFFLYIILLFISFNNNSINLSKFNKSILVPFRVLIISSFVFFVVAGFVIKKKPLQWNLEYRKILDYVKEMPSRQSIYYSEYQYEWLLSYIRPYAKNPIYSDDAFTFNESKIKEWHERYENGKKFRIKLKSGNLIEMCNIDNYSIDFYIYKNENKLLQKYSKKINDQTNILDINAFKKECNNNFQNK